MGQKDKSPELELSFETRELAWELQQDHPDNHRVRYLMEKSANLREAMRMANVREQDLSRKAVLKPLQLHRHLQH